MRISLIIFSLWLVGSCGLGKPDSVMTPDGIVISNPVEYNNYFIARQQSILQAMATFSEHLGSFDLPIIHNAHITLIKTIEAQKQLITDTPPFDADSILQPAFIDLFEFYTTISQVEYGRIVEIIAKGEEEITQQDLLEIDSLTKSINLLKIKTDVVFSRAQQAFAHQYDLEIGSLEN
jgi:hypothetical protein